MSKEKVLHDPIRPKERKADKEFAAPTKAIATTGYFMSAGDLHGSGFKNPVGTEKVRSVKEGPIPQESACFRCEEAIRR